MTLTRRDRRYIAGGIVFILTCIFVSTNRTLFIDYGVIALFFCLILIGVIVFSRPDEHLDEIIEEKVRPSETLIHHRPYLIRVWQSLDDTDYSKYQGYKKHFKEDETDTGEKE